MLAEINWTSEMIMGAGFFVLLICIVLGSFWYRVTLATSENELKRSMVERGMSAEEIERVLAARTPGRKG